MFATIDLSNSDRGVRYQRRKRAPAPCVSRAVESGTLIRITGRAAAEVKINSGGRPAETRLPTAITKPHPNVAIGAINGPTDAMPSVANNDALKFPSL